MRTVPYSLGWNDHRQKPSGKWEARWADETGRARGKCFLTETQAKYYALARAKEVADGALGLGPIIKELEPAINQFLNQYTNIGTRKIYGFNLGLFTSLFPLVRCPFNITQPVLDELQQQLVKRGYNPGGRRLVLRTLKTFCTYCVEQKWLLASPFVGYEMPVSNFKARALTPAEFAQMVEIDPGRAADPHINRMLRLMYLTTLRVSHIWGLRVKDFREPNLLFVEGIKHQDTEWKELHPEAVEIIRELCADKEPYERLFTYWTHLDSVRASVREKAERLGLGRIRPHDAGKVTRVTDLFDMKMSPGDVSHITNTTKGVLVSHYLQADKKRAIQRSMELPGSPVGLAKNSGSGVVAQTGDRPTEAPKTTEKDPLEQMLLSQSNDESALDLVRKWISDGKLKIA